ncbi:hypothetical protein K0M31_017231 [Melipona bicolor]|uniref:Uncharacterized protein n=1 Tax=Melipona bicolor TaxID=60889 RepID=A0AA40G4P3_9HYME|nr:hypothetical protein K0M31_017231 [Melipona bicolor]
MLKFELVTDLEFHCVLKNLTISDFNYNCKFDYKIEIASNKLDRKVYEKNSDIIMGNYINKFFIHNTEISNNEVEKEEIKHPSPINEATVEKDIMQTPPITHKMLIIDPRSITSGITRTPIEVNSTPVGVNKRLLAIPRHLQPPQYLETDMDRIMLCLSPRKPSVPKIMDTPTIQLPKDDKDADMLLTPTTNNLLDKKTIMDIEEERYKILGLDPRSPAADFDRTPILMPKSIERLRARSQNYLHRCGSYDTDMFCQKFSYCELSSQFNVTEIQALPDLATSATESLNPVIKNDDDKSSESKSSCSSYSSETECISAIEQKLEEQDESQKPLEQDICNDVRVNENTDQTKCMLSDTIKVWKDPLVLDESQKVETDDSENAQIIEEKIPQALKEEVIITFDDDNIIELANSKNEKAKIDVVKKKKKSLKSDIKFITDENKFFNPSDKNRSVKVRTPLRNRSNDEQVQILLTKSPQVFKNKDIITKVSQENTSPHKRYITKSKLNDMWDSDSTVII